LVIKAAVFPGLLNGRTGGIVRSATLHSSMLASANIETSIFGLFTKEIPASTEGLPIGNAKLILNTAIEKKHSISSPELINCIKENIKKFDVAHLNGHWSIINYRIAKICYDNKVPYIISSRGSRSSHLHENNQSFIKHLSSHEKLYIENSACVHVTSEHEIKVSDLSNTKKIIKIPNAVDLDHIQTSPNKKVLQEYLDIPKDTINFLYYGRVAPEKNIEFIIRSLKSIKEKDFLLYVVGEPDINYQKKLIDLAKNEGVIDKVIFKGYIEGEERGKWLAACDVFLLPSFGENFGLSLAEGVAAGMHCIASDKVGATEFLSEDVCKTLPLDIKLWTKACKELVNKEDIKTTTPRLEIIQQFSAASIMKEWEEVYKRNILKQY